MNVQGNRFFRDSESNWDEHREWIYWTNLVKKSNFESTGAPITLFSSPVAKPISMRSVYRFFLFESEQHVRCRRRRNVSGLRRCTFDLTESRRFFPHRRIYFSSLIRNISLTPFNLSSFDEQNVISYVQISLFNFWGTAGCYILFFDVYHIYNLWKWMDFSKCFIFVQNLLSRYIFPLLSTYNFAITILRIKNNLSTWQNHRRSTPISSRSHEYYRIVPSLN